MARARVKKKEVVEYQLTLTQEEFDLVCGVVNDLADQPLIGPERHTGIFYNEYGDEEVSIPKKKTRAVFAGIAAVMNSLPSPDFHYYDWWKVKSLDDKG